jgi:hypothetical protein
MERMIHADAKKRRMHLVGKETPRLVSRRLGRKVVMREIPERD